MADSKRSDAPRSNAGDNEGTHPAVPVSQGADSADGKQYKDNPDKPDPTTVAQVEVLPADRAGG